MDNKKINFCKIKILILFLTIISGILTFFELDFIVILTSTFGIFQAIRIILLDLADRILLKYPEPFSIYAKILHIIDTVVLIISVLITIIILALFYTFDESKIFIQKLINSFSIWAFGISFTFEYITNICFCLFERKMKKRLNACFISENNID